MVPAADNIPRDQRYLNTLPAIVSGFAVLIAGAFTLIAYTLGPQSGHMAIHIALMNIAAPFSAAALGRKFPDFIGRPRTLWAATATQIVLLWAWHVPALQINAAASHGLQVVMHASLFLSAFFFWSSICRLREAKRWHAVPALLLTGKLACLLSALVIFSPRVLYDFGGHAPSSADDQQLAGLLMITACPISYLVAAVVATTLLVGSVGTAPNPRTHSQAG